MKYTKRRLDDSMAPTVEEKEKKLREGLLMMGLRYSVFWASWALTYAAVAVLVSAGMAAIFVGTGMLRLTSPLLVVALLASFGCSLVPLSMAMSTLFSSAKTAGPVANLVCTAAAFPFMAVCTSDPARTAPRTPR